MRLNYIDCCDCLDGLRDVPDGSVDLVVTDPPYGINYQSSRSKTAIKPKIIGDERPYIAFIPKLKRILKRSGGVLIFTRWDVQQVFIDEMTRCGMRPKDVLIWDKLVRGMGDLRRAPGRRYESIIWYAGDDFRFPLKRPVDVVQAARVSPNKLMHPNEKPVALLKTLIRDYGRKGDTVLDCCMGSGSTAVACLETGRNFIGFELDERYHAMAMQRIAAMVADLKEKES